MRVLNRFLTVDLPLLIHWQPFDYGIGQSWPPPSKSAARQKCDRSVGSAGRRPLNSQTFEMQPGRCGIARFTTGLPVSDRKGFWNFRLRALMWLSGVRKQAVPMLGLKKKSASELAKHGNEAGFAADVIEASRKIPVVAYFSASWCGPCKTFGPALEKAVQEARGAVTLVKFDVDECQRLAAQLGVQSVPTVFGFVDGQPVDGFMGAQPTSQLKAFVGKLAGPAGGGDTEAKIEAAENLLTSGAAVDAAQMFAGILSEDSENPAALGGMARAYLALGNLDTAQKLLTSAPDSIAGATEVLAAKAAVDLARQAAAAGPVGELQAKVSADPSDHEARFELAVALHAQGRNEDAVNELLELFRRDREWRDGAAREQLLKIFESLKPNDPVALKGRRRLSSLVFA